MIFKFCTIASGSSGNCIYVGTNHTNVLIDAGISGKKIEQGLQSIGLHPSKIDGIFITHEHSDHIKGVGVLSRRYNIPIFATKDTWDEMLVSPKTLGKINRDQIEILDKHKDFILHDLVIHPYEIPHDAADPVAYTFHSGNKKISIATDLGHINNRIYHQIEESNLILLESNHDIRMLQTGSYPYFLKQRILGDYGHLCNEVAGQMLANIYHDQLNTIILGHLSRENNFPDLAFETVKQELQTAGIELSDKLSLYVAKRDSVSPIFEV